MNQLPEPWRVVSDKQAHGSDFRNLIVVGPGAQKPERRYWMAFNTRRDCFRETSCMRYLRQQDKGIVRRVGDYVRSTRPNFYHHNPCVCAEQDKRRYG